MATPFAPATTLTHPRSILRTSPAPPYPCTAASTPPSPSPSPSACLRSFQRPLAHPTPLRRNLAAFGVQPKRTPAIGRARCGNCRAGLEAVVFDCDGVILESEDLHRRSYNAAFREFRVRCSPAPESGTGEESEESEEGFLLWTPEFYDVLQNTVGGGKPKMRWYFARHGWPTSSILPSAPSTEEEQAILIDTIQDWKTEKYKNFIGSGDVETRPGVLRLMDATRKLGLKLAVCSAATKSSVVFTLSNLLGKERFEGLDCFLAGDDVDKKKPDPTIYIKAAQTLGVAPENCLVIEDSVIGLQAALGAGMPCIISYTSSTSAQDFSAAKAVYPNLGSVRLEDLTELLEGTPVSL